TWHGDPDAPCQPQDVEVGGWYRRSRRRAGPVLSGRRHGDVALRHLRAARGEGGKAGQLQDPRSRRPLRRATHLGAAHGRDHPHELRAAVTMADMTKKGPKDQLEALTGRDRRWWVRFIAKRVAACSGPQGKDGHSRTTSSTAG